jgi:negative regulator of sigma E activity
MNKSLVVAAALALAVGVASAQSPNPPAQSGPNNPAVNTTGTNNANQPVAGANSFTEGQAKSRIEESGYKSVSELKKDDNGVWRGKAMKDGKPVTVSLDFQGNVIAR